MKIVIAGAGEVGSHLAKMLSGESHDIMVIDLDPKLLDELSGLADIITIEGDATTFTTLKRASVRKADLFIGVAHEESTNIISAMLAKQLGARKVIARIDNDEYLAPNNRELFINIGIDYLFHPEKLTAKEVVNLLGHTATTEYVDFSGGKLVLVAYKVDAASQLVDKTLIEVAEENKNLHYRIAAINRAGETIIPHGNDKILEEDRIYIITDSDSEYKVMELSGKPNIDIRSLMILGGSRIGIRIASELQNEIDVKLIEYNQDKAYKLAEVLDNTLIIHEDGRNTEAMLEEGLANTDAFVAVTGRSETNILAAMLAHRVGVKKVIAEVENLNYINIAAGIGVDTVVNKKLITASNIFRFTMTTDVQAIRVLTGCDAEVMEFIVKPNSPATKAKIKELDFPEGAIIGGVVRGDSVYIAVGDTEINAYDRVVVFALPDAIHRIGRFFNVT